jgi:hypothetical protein
MKFVLRVPARQSARVSSGPTRFIAPFPTSDTSRPTLTMVYWQTSSQTFFTLISCRPVKISEPIPVLSP